MLALRPLTPKQMGTSIYYYYYYYYYCCYRCSVRVAVLFKDCSRLTAGVAGSNPTEDIDVRLLCLLRVLCVAAYAMG